MRIYGVHRGVQQEFLCRPASFCAAGRSRAKPLDRRTLVRYALRYFPRALSPVRDRPAGGGSVFALVDRTVEILEEVSRALEPELVDGRDAARLLQKVARGERL